ncbi:MAG: hypothetical protein JO280_13810 [Mycobacteriaceae bacterium]|nr:hypothetical protein [Mycobacteriaceae bacterium]
MSDVVNPGIPAGFDEVVSRGMANDPKDRHFTAGDLATKSHDALHSPEHDATVAAVLTAPTAAAGVSGASGAPPGFSAQPTVVASSQPPYPPPPPSGPTGPGYWGPTSPGGPGGPGGTPPWQPPGSGPMPSAQPPKRNWVPIIIAAVVAFVLVLGGVIAAVVLMNKSNNSNNASGTTTTTTARTTTSSTKTSTTTHSASPTTSGPSGASARLMSLLPDGYGPDACKPIDPVTDALATVDCQKNTETGGPDVARYSLFPDQTTLDRHFDSATKEDDELVMCPGSNVQSPTTWHYTSTPDKVEGQVACGTYKGGPDLLWTRNADLLLADGQGPDMAALHQWWLKYG